MNSNGFPERLRIMRCSGAQGSRRQSVTASLKNVEVTISLDVPKRRMVHRRELSRVSIDTIECCIAPLVQGPVLVHQWLARGLSGRPVCAASGRLFPRIADVDVAVVVTVTPVTARLHLDKNGWPLGFFERVAGSMPALRRGTQGDFEERLPLE